MAKYFKYLTFFVFSSSFLVLSSSCQEGGEAGDLFGMWRLQDAESLYISFAGSVTELRNTKNEPVFGNFQHVGDSLFIQCYSINGIPTDTAIVESFFGSEPMNNIRLKIDLLDDDDLTVSKNERRWHFYKY